MFQSGRAPPLKDDNGCEYMQGLEAKGEAVEGSARPQLVLLTDINGCFRPGVLTCLMGVSGAGKTTLMDVLAGRKTGGHLSTVLLSPPYEKSGACYMTQ